VWSLSRLLDDKSTTILPTQLAQFARVNSVTAAGNVVTITLSERDNDFLYSLSQRGGVIFKKDASDFANSANGTGPFVLTKWDKGNSITLDRFDTYWGRRSDSKTVVFRYFADASALSNAMLAGDIDIMTTVQSPETLEVFESRSDLKVLSGSTNCEVTLSMNNSRAPFNNVAVRKAVRQAIDKSALIDVAWAGYGTEIGSFVPPTDPWFEDLTDVAPFDVDASRDALVSAGVAPGTPITLDVPPINYATNSSEFIAAALKDVGFSVTITPVTWEEWLDRVFTKADYDMSIVCHIERNDMAIYANPNYYFRFDNADYRELITAASAASTSEERTAALRGAARLLSEQSASDWLWLMPNLQVAKRDRGGSFQECRWRFVLRRPHRTRLDFVDMSGVLRRLAVSGAGILGSTFIVFALLRVLPGDLATAKLGTDATPEALQRLRSEYGLDKPLFTQYVQWLGNAVRGRLWILSHVGQ